METFKIWMEGREEARQKQLAAGNSPSQIKSTYGSVPDYDQEPDEGKIKVWLDDERPAPPGWTHVITPGDAITLLKKGNVEEISLDNDLGLDAYVPPNQGKHVANWIEQGAIEGTLAPIKVKIHTQNPIAKEQMKAALRNAYKAWHPEMFT